MKGIQWRNMTAQERNRKSFHVKQLDFGLTQELIVLMTEKVKNG